MSTPIPRYQVIQSDISFISYEDTLNWTVEQAKARQSNSVYFVNVHMLIEARRNPVLNDAISNAGLAVADGVPLTCAIKLLYGKTQERVAGMDIFDDMLAKAEQNDLSVYFMGTTDEILDSICKKAQRLYPDLKIAGSYSPPFRPLSEAEDQALTERINESGAQILFVALGCPKQELWISQHKGNSKIKAVMVGIGGVFPVFAGVQSRAPKWMQRYSLEWFYRWLQEPRRLFARYFETNSLFCIYLLKQLLTPRLCSR